MIETKTAIIIHIPKCGGYSLRHYSQENMSIRHSVVRRIPFKESRPYRYLRGWLDRTGIVKKKLPHDGLFALSEKQRRKQIFALTRNRKEWYQSCFQYYVQTQNPWLSSFGLPYELTADNFKKFLERATVAPPEKQVHRIDLEAISIPFDSFPQMREKRYGLWSFWYDLLCSDDPSQPKIAEDITFIPCGHPDFFPQRIMNQSTYLDVTWTPEMLGHLEVDDEIAQIVRDQLIHDAKDYAL